MSQNNIIDYLSTDKTNMECFVIVKFAVTRQILENNIGTNNFYFYNSTKL
jgi:hypothetical protein